MSLWWHISQGLLVHSSYLPGPVKFTKLNNKTPNGKASLKHSHRSMATLVFQRSWDDNTFLYKDPLPLQLPFICSTITILKWPYLFYHFPDNLPFLLKKKGKERNIDNNSTLPSWGSYVLIQLRPRMTCEHKSQRRDKVNGDSNHFLWIPAKYKVKMTVKKKGQYSIPSRQNLSQAEISQFLW